MLSHVWSATVVGVECVLVRVEANVVGGLPGLSIVGLPQGAVREGKDRVQAALRHGKWKLPPRRITVNLAPADLRKDGSSLDLPMAVSLILTLDDAGFRVPPGTVFLGELGLDGSLRPVRGALAVARRSALEGMVRLVVPEENAPEASAASPGLEVLGASSLQGVVRHLKGEDPLEPVRYGEGDGVEEPGPRAPDLSHVRGQQAAKRALEVAAAGGHNLLMSGPPGSGKTFLARCLPGILPRLTRQESLEVTTIHSVAGLLPPGVALMRRAPFRAPHHTVSPAGLAGGGAPLRPGEVSLAHRGVLFLDELPEFGRHTLEILRQPMEDGVIAVVRARERARFPARFALVAAMNPWGCVAFLTLSLRKGSRSGEARGRSWEEGRRARSRPRRDGS